MRTYLFPGQGSQIKGMGQILFDEFKELTEKADTLLGYSIKELCLEDPDKQLHLTQFTQPALYVVNALAYYKKLKEDEQKPDFVAGHSLGEYNALLASGGFDFETGLKLVKKRGELMSRASGGGMAAVIGLSEDRTREILQENQLSVIDIANINAPTQIVISGLIEDINKAQAYFDKAGATYVPLNVSAAFHSRYMQEAKDEFKTYLSDFKFSELAIPVISNVNALPYQQDDIINNLANQLRSSVKWLDSIRYLMDQGNTEFEELGVGDVLTKLVEKIKLGTPTIKAENSTEKTQMANSRTVAKESVDPKLELNVRSNLQDEAKSPEIVPQKESIDQDKEVPENEDAGRKEFIQMIKESETRVANWNKTYSIGTKVSVDGYDEELETRTEAMILFGHRAAIYMKGYNGYFALDEVKAV